MIPLPDRRVLLYLILMAATMVCFASCRRFHSVHTDEIEYPNIRDLEGVWTITSYEINETTEFRDSISLLNGQCGEELSIQFIAAQSKFGTDNPVLLLKQNCSLAGTFQLMPHGYLKIQLSGTDSLLAAHPNFAIYDHLVWMIFMLQENSFGLQTVRNYQLNRIYLTRK